MVNADFMAGILLGFIMGVFILCPNRTAICCGKQGYQPRKSIINKKAIHLPTKSGVPHKRGE